MKSCPTCYRHTTDSLRFCSHDGTPLVAGDKRCPVCFQGYPTSFLHCVADGAALPGTPHRHVRPAPSSGPVSAVIARRAVLAGAAAVVMFLVGAVIGVAQQRRTPRTDASPVARETLDVRVDAGRRGQNAGDVAENGSNIRPATSAFQAPGLVARRSEPSSAATVSVTRPPACGSTKR